MTEAILQKFRGEKFLAKNILWNFGTQILPVLIAFFTIPIIMNGIGIDRFGLLTLIWAIIGYSSIFDLGLGRALTQLVSQKLGSGEVDDLPVVIWTALIISVLLSMIGGILVYAFASYIVINLIKVNALYSVETIYSIKLLAFALPFLVMTLCLTGVLQSYQKFSTIMLIRIPLGLINFVGPLFILPFSKNLAYIVAILLIGRIITCIMCLFACSKVIENFFTKINFQASLIKPLLNIGGWMTVSNLVMPIMVYIDRFFIASMLTVGVVAFYTVPYEIINRMVIIPSAIMGVVFPAFSSEYQRDKQRAKDLFNKSFKYILFLLIIPVLASLLFAKIGLSLWTSPQFSLHSYHVAQILAVCILINSLSFPSFALIQAAGRPDITAKMHIVQTILYVGCLWFFIKWFGLMGAAYAFLLRVIIDTALQYFISLKILNK